MKKSIGILLGCLFCQLSFAGEKLDSIVAVVNDDVVTESEFHRSLTIAKAQIEQSGAQADNQLEKHVLDQLINKKLQLQIAQQAGIKITDTDLDRIIKNVADKNNLSVQALYDRLREDGMNATDYRGELRDQMTVQKLQQQEIASHISVSPSEVTSFMRSKVWQHSNTSTSKVYHLEDILVPLADNSTPVQINAAKACATRIATELNNGKKFDVIAKNEPGIENNDLGWRKINEMPSLFTKSLSGMQPNQIAGPLEAGNGYHIIRLIDVRADGEDSAANDPKQVEQYLMQRKFQQNIENWVSKVRGQAFISMKKTDNEAIS